MARSTGPEPKPDRRQAAVCGLFCPACPVFLSTREDPERLQKIADAWNLPVEGVRCDGCRSDRRFVYCRTRHLVSFAAERGVDFGGQCDDYPCQELTEFQDEIQARRSRTRP